jgi:hypothetical protein
VALTQQDVPVRQSPVEQFYPANDTKKILLDESDQTKFVIIGTGLSANRKASSPASSMRIETSSLGLQKTCQVPRELAEHSLHVRPDAKLVNQLLWQFAEEKRKAIGEEFAWLFIAGFIMEVFYPEWLVNPVLVLKKNNTWCMCIDYTSLNKACPKDPFVLPRINQVIDSMAGCNLLSFLDAYSSYHQILLYQSDQIKMSFITPYRAYYYVTMPFSLKNTGATYQRTMQRCLQG